MPQVLVPVDLADTRAIVGRQVSITVPVGYPDGASSAALSSATSRARQRLQGLVQGGRVQLEPHPSGEGADLTVQGRLAAPWTTSWALRRAAYEAAQAGGLEYGVEFQGFGPEDVSVLDLDTPPVERTIAGPGNWLEDSTGELAADGTYNVDVILAHGAKQGLENTGEAFGAVAKGIGSGVKASLGGFFGGLGTGGTIVFLVILALVAVGALLYVFGPAFLLGAARGG